jgi:hypothetical protein
MAQRKNTYVARVSFYSPVYMRFGYGSDWNGKSPKGRAEEYIKFTDEIAKKLTTTYGQEFLGSGIRLQIKMATSKQGRWSGARSGDSMATQVMGNKVAAYDAGFIRLSDFPNAMFFYHGKKKGHKTRKPVLPKTE